MGLLSRFQRKAIPSQAPLAPGDEVHRARTRARQRLIGAVVLVGIGIVGFPLLFETHPRPIPVDIPIEIANKDKAPPLAMPPPRQQGTASAATAPASAAAAQPPNALAGAAATETASDTNREAPAAPSHKTEAAAATAKTPSAAVAEGARARATLEGKPVATARDDANGMAAEGRFVVQVGAYAEAASAREARQRAEKLGLKTYTQVVETQAGNRIRVRVGPFASRDEADRAAGKLKSAGLPAALLTL